MWYRSVFILACQAFLASAITKRATTGITKDMGPAPEFTVNDIKNVPCILIKINATITIEPQRVANKKYSVDLPRYAETKGQCISGEDSKIVFKWSKSFQLSWHFQKSHVSDAWYVDYIQFSYNTAEKVFNGDEGTGAGEVQEIHSPSSFTLWLTPVGQAYECGITQDVKLMDKKKERRITITLRQIKIQPFASMTSRQYGDSFVCPEEAGRRDETVPIAVGSTLAIVVLLTVSAYGGYRYFKVKKIEYDTME